MLKKDGIGKKRGGNRRKENERSDERKKGFCKPCCPGGFIKVDQSMATRKRGETTDWGRIDVEIGSKGLRKGLGSPCAMQIVCTAQKKTGKKRKKKWGSQEREK